jgi:hypothetical protein
MQPSFIVDRRDHPRRSKLRSPLVEPVIGTDRTFDQGRSKPSSAPINPSITAG